jgi:vitamin B12 transporter
MTIFSTVHVLATALALSTPSPSPTPPPQIVHVVTGDRSDETLGNATRTTYVVSAAQIAKQGYRTVGDALAAVPGVEISNYGPIGANVSYGIRGSSSAQVLVLVDGAPAPGSFSNSVPLGTMTTAGVKRIEVVEGGGSTLYGEGAIGGIINVITDGKNAPSALLQYGTFDDALLRVSGGGFTLERIVANDTYGLPPSADPATGLSNPATRSNSDYEATSARYGLDRRAGAVQISLRASLESDSTGAAGYFPSLSTTSREDDVNQGATLALSHAGAQSLATLQFGGTRQQIAFACLSSDPNCALLDPALSTESRSDLSFRNVVHGDSSRLIYGADFSRGVVRSDDGAGDVTYDALAQAAGYAQENWSTRNAEFYAGLRAERDGSLGGEYSPSVGARFDLGRALTLKANAANAFRAPNASELYFPGYGNPNLVPERARVGDLTLADSAFLGGASIGWFTNDTRNLIVASCIQYCPPTVPPPNQYPVYAPENVAHSLAQGLTLEVHTVPYNGITTSLGVTDLYEAVDLSGNTRLPNDPVFSVDLALDVAGPARGWFAGAGAIVRSVGASGYVDPTQPLFYQPAAYTTVDAHASVRAGTRTLLTFRGYNLGNERYAAVGGYPMPGRTLTVELSSRP